MIIFADLNADLMSKNISLLKNEEKHGHPALFRIL